jgi:hypothetical protein
MIRITISGGACDYKEFPRTKSGHAQSRKFLESVYEKRKNDPWFYNLKAIEKIETKLNDWQFRTNSKAGIRLKVELEQLKKQRDEALQMLGITSAPDTIKVEILTD